jgi:hypothetical protein
MNFYQHVSFSINGQSFPCNLNYDLEGVLTLAIDYTSDIEGLPAALALSYDPATITLPPSVLFFKMVGHNNPLIFAE